MTAAAAAGLLVAACGAGHLSAPGTAAAPSHSPGKVVVAHMERAFPYNLYTHCGISEAKIGDRFYQAVTPLSDGNGNPPAGWGNPYQAGLMAQVSATEAVFTDQAGHHVIFRLRAGATTFQHICS